MRYAMKTGKNAALVVAALVLALTYFVSSSYGADTTSGGQTTVKSGTEQKPSADTTNKPAQSKPKTNNAQTSTTTTVPNYNLKTLPYPGSGK